MAAGRTTPVLLGLGSNINRYRHLVSALDALQAAFGEMACSPVYESEAVGFDGSPFLNSVVQVTSDRPLAELIPLFKRIEDDNGRDREGPKFSPRTLDIDVLTYGEATGWTDGIWLPRDEITRNAFVLKPLADLVPDWILPGTDRTYASLWTEYPKDAQRLWRVEFDWHGLSL